MVTTDISAERSRDRIFFQSHGLASCSFFFRSIVPAGGSKPRRSVPDRPLVRRTAPWTTPDPGARSRQTFVSKRICNSKAGSNRRLPRSARTHSLPFLLLLAIVAALSGCSKEGGNAGGTANGQGSARANATDEQRYSCNDGSKWHVDSLADGLTITLTSMPNGKQERLDAPAQGLTFVGDGISATFSQNGMTIERSEGPSVACQRN